MSRVAAAVLALLFVWQSCLILTREPSHPRALPTEEDYPLAVGYVWVYKAPGGWQVIRKLAGEAEVGGHRWFDMQFTLPFGKEQLYMRRTAEGILGRRGDREGILIKFPMKPGDTWTIDLPERPVAHCTVLEPEVIEVLGTSRTASKLEVVKVDRKSGQKTKNYEWYVRGIGLAQMQVTYGITAKFTLERFEKAK